MPNNKSLPYLPTISFFAPHWELVFCKKLAIGGYGVKTRSNAAYKHRGLVLCYTAQKAHLGPVHSHGLDNENIPRGVVGCAFLVDVRALSANEKLDLFVGYNNIRNNDYNSSDPDLIYAMDYGYFMKPVYRFPKPFMPPVQHMYGPVGRIPLYPEIERQLPRWARRGLAIAA
jgi:hypothetical protein